MRFNQCSFRDVDAWPEQAQASADVDENGYPITQEYELSKDLIANVFKGGLNMYAPQFKKVEIYPYDQDNYARLVD